MKQVAVIAVWAVAFAVLAGCTQAYYDKKRAADGTTQQQTNSITKQEVTNNANNVAGAVDKGSGQFGGWLKQHGFNVHTKDNPPPDNSSGK